APTRTPTRFRNASSWAPMTICPSRLIRRSCARGSGRPCADSRYARWRANTWAIENEKRHSENLLRNILPAEIATRLRNGESNIADHFDDATVIFADVVSFGKITARMKAYEIVACLNQLFSEFDRLAEDAGIEKIKTIGDNYMAVCGVPTLRSNHACMAAKFALGMVGGTGRLGSRLPAPFPIRVGLHSGPVMAGVIGTRKFAYDVWGDTVNIAARLEAASQPNRVLASAATVKALGSQYRFDGPQKID